VSVLLTAAEWSRMTQDELRRTRPGLTFIYFIQVGDAGPIKIGTSANPVGRLRNAQVNNHEQLRLLAVHRTHPHFERDLHQDFATDRIRGEWYRPVPGLIRAIEECAEGPDLEWAQEIEQ
jgi:hypothetical protein